MKPTQIFKFLQSKLSRVSDQDDAIKMFEKQQGALQAIKDTQGLQEIKDYFYRVYDNSCNKLWEVDVNDAWKVACLRSEMNIARDFLTFLGNITE